MYRRAFAVLVAFGALALALTARVGAGGDTIGASVQSRVYLAESREVAVLNRATVPLRFRIEPAAGLTAEPAALILEPDQPGTFTLTGELNGEPVRLTIHADQLTSTPSAETTALAFGVLVAAERPWEPPWLLILAVALVAVLVALRGLRWSLR
jgi:hypothetical protein